MNQKPKRVVLFIEKKLYCAQFLTITSYPKKLMQMLIDCIFYECIHANLHGLINAYSNTHEEICIQLFALEMYLYSFIVMVYKHIYMLLIKISVHICLYSFAYVRIFQLWLYTHININI